MTLKKLVAPALALTLLLSMSAPAFAADRHSFTDVPTWADAAVSYCYDKGYVNGTSATTYHSDGQISVVEFVKVMVQMCTTQERRTTIMDRARASPEQGTDWTYQYRTIGKEIGLYAGIEQYEGDKGESKCTRAVMAHILVNALNARGEDTSAVDATAYLDYFADAMAIKNSPYVNDIGTAISLGLIGGDNNRNFLPDDLMNRASAAQIFIRLDNPNGERQAVLDILNEKNTTENGSALGAITIDMRNPGSHRAPKEGDTVIRPDGSSVVLTRTHGVLGFGQNVGAWLGTAGSTGATVESGTFAMGEASWSDPLAIGVYTQSNVKGQESTFHWVNEWVAIQRNTRPTNDGVEGQVDETGLWKFENNPALGGVWFWQGPNL